MPIQRSFFSINSSWRTMNNFLFVCLFYYKKKFVLKTRTNYLMILYFNILKTYISTTGKRLQRPIYGRSKMSHSICRILIGNRVQVENPPPSSSTTPTSLSDRMALSNLLLELPKWWSFAFLPAMSSVLRIGWYTKTRNKVKLKSNHSPFFFPFLSIFFYLSVPSFLFFFLLFVFLGTLLNIQNSY